MALYFLSKNQPAGTILLQIRGPLTGRNWFTLTINPVYRARQIGTGTIALQGTNDVIWADTSSLNPVSRDMLPPDNASWTNLASGNGALDGNFNTSYLFLQWVITVQGTGGISDLSVNWN
jgi:hypothetical protein